MQCADIVYNPEIFLLGFLFSHVFSITQEVFFTFAKSIIFNENSIVILMCEDSSIFLKLLKGRSDLN